MIHRLGALPSVYDEAKHGPLLSLASYFEAKKPLYPAPPPARDWTGDGPYEIALNNKLGCCTIAAIVHLLQCHAMRHGGTLTISDADILRAYMTVSGYDGTPQTDRGAMPIDALTYARDVWQVIVGFVKVNPNDQHEMHAAINLFGGVYVAARLPKRIYEQGTDWELPPLGQRSPQDEPGSLGGHAFASLGYNHTHYKVMPWTDATEAGNAWFDEYVDEAYAVLTPRWVDQKHIAPNGFDLTALRKDLKLI